MSSVTTSSVMSQLTYDYNKDAVVKPIFFFYLKLHALIYLDLAIFFCLLSI